MADDKNILVPWLAHLLLPSDLKRARILAGNLWWQRHNAEASALLCLQRAGLPYSTATFRQLADDQGLYSGYPSSAAAFSCPASTIRFTQNTALDVQYYTLPAACALAPFINNRLTTAGCPVNAAKCSGVHKSYIQGDLYGLTFYVCATDLIQRHHVCTSI
jgi:hypothetical protein